MSGAFTDGSDPNKVRVMLFAGLVIATLGLIINLIRPSCDCAKAGG